MDQATKVDDKEEINGESISIPSSSSDKIPQSAPVMDTGYRAWLVCFASLWTNGTIFGIINSVGVLYVELAKKYEYMDNGIILVAIIGSLCVGFTFLLSPVAGVLTDRFGITKIALVGSIIAAVGMFLSSFVETLALYYLTFGILLGTGCSLGHTTSIVILGHYFTQRLGLVNGIVSFGSSIFTIVLPLMLKYLFKEIGLQHTLRLLALLLSSLIGCSLIFRPQLPVEETRENSVHTHHLTWMYKCQHFCTKIINVNLWNNKKYRIWVLTTSMALFGYFVPYMYLIAYVEQTYPTKNGEMLVSCMGITSGFGGIIFGRLGDLQRVNRIFLQQLSFFCIGVLTIILPHVQHYEALIVICLGLGLFNGCFISLLGPIAIDLTGVHRASQAIGFLLGLFSIPLTLGPPIAGWIREWTGDFQAAFIYAGIPPIVGSFVMILIFKVKGDNPYLPERRNWRQLLVTSQLFQQHLRTRIRLKIENREKNKRIAPAPFSRRTSLSYCEPLPQRGQSANASIRFPG